MNKQPSFMQKIARAGSRRKKSTSPNDQSEVSERDNNVSTSFVKLEEDTPPQGSERSEDLEKRQQEHKIPKNARTLSHTFQEESRCSFNDSDRNRDSKKLHYNAEEGIAVLQILAFFGGTGLVFSSILGFQEYAINDLSLHNVIISFYSWIFGMFIIALEGRILMLNFSSMHILVSNYFKILRLMWGRGLFYIFVGCFHYCMNTLYSTICAVFFVVIGLVTYICGIFMSKRLQRFLKDSKKAIFTQEIFDFYDIDEDGFIDAEGFRDLVIGTGMKSINIDAEFIRIDENRDGLVVYSEVKNWFDAVDFANKSKLEGIDALWIY